MSDATEFVAFLRAQLDDDERIARAADGSWRAEAQYQEEAWSIKSATSTPDFMPSCDGDVVGPGYEGGGVWFEADAVHIARHDPARVLREVEAKRRIVDGLAYLTDIPPQDVDGTVVMAWDVLRSLAAVYADHPEFREEWRP